jgi:hypothetical protein
MNLSSLLATVYVFGGSGFRVHRFRVHVKFEPANAYERNVTLNVEP